MSINVPIAFNIEKMTLENNAFRNVFDTSDQMQLVFMSLLPGEDIGMEVHPHVTQFIRIEDGIGIAILNGKEYNVGSGSAIFIPAGTWHNVINIGDRDLKLYTLYAPPNHPPETYEYIKNEE